MLCYDRGIGWALAKHFAESIAFNLTTMSVQKVSTTFVLCTKKTHRSLRRVTTSEDVQNFSSSRDF